MNNRSTFTTKLGVIATAVGSAVGLGNIWRFPYEAGQNGGGAFLLIYLIFVIILGIPLVSAEFLIGRSSHSNVSGAFKKLAPKTHWNVIGYLSIRAPFLILGFYTVIAGWTVEYLFQAFTNSFAGQTPDLVKSLSRHIVVTLGLAPLAPTKGRLFTPTKCSEREPRCHSRINHYNFASRN